MQEGDPSVTVVEPHSEERRYLIDRTARFSYSTVDLQHSSGSSSTAACLLLTCTMLPCSYDVTKPAATMYRYVAKDGAALESSLMSRESNNPEFAFLFEHGTEEGVYYSAVEAAANSLTHTLATSVNCCLLLPTGGKRSV
eukprot:20213-Heterococcus_DN1.PRE.2